MLIFLSTPLPPHSLFEERAFFQTPYEGHPLPQGEREETCTNSKAHLLDGVYTKTTSKIGFGIIFCLIYPNTYLKTASHFSDVLGRCFRQVFWVCVKHSLESIAFRCYQTSTDLYRRQK